MIKLVILLSIFLITSAFIPLSLGEGTIGIPQGVLREGFTSIKFLDAYFGTEESKIEVAPGDRNVPFTVIMSNVGTQDITGIKGRLILSPAFPSPSGLSVPIMADNDQKASAGDTFSLTFFVDVSELALIKDHTGAIQLDFSRLRESGERKETFDFTFKLTGDSVVNLKPTTNFLTSIKNNQVVIEISNAGTAPLNNVDIVLQNDQTSVSSQSQSITNLENVIFDQTHWDVGTIEPKSATIFSFSVFIPDALKNEPLHLPMEITYYDAHGTLQTVTRVADFYINGLVDPSIYGVKVIELSGQQTIIGEILNEGNSDGLFGFITLKPRGDSNIKESTQYIDEIEPDSPVPFNIPIEFIGEERFGEHEITIQVKYKDSVRNNQIITYDTKISIDASSIINSDGYSLNTVLNGMSIEILIVALIVIAIVIIIVKKKRS